MGDWERLRKEAHYRSLVGRLDTAEARVAELEAALESIRDNSRDVEAASIAASALAQKGDEAK